MLVGNGVRLDALSGAETLCYGHPVCRLKEPVPLYDEDDDHAEDDAADGEAVVELEPRHDGLLIRRTQ